MSLKSRSGFALPLALLMGSTIMILSALALSVEWAALRQARIRKLHIRTERTLENAVPGLVRLMEERILTSDSASANRHDPEIGIWHPFMMGKADSQIRSTALASAGDAPQVSCLAVDGSTRLGAKLAPILQSEEHQDIEMSLAWVAEDLTIRSPLEPPVPFWPLPAYSHSPVEKAESAAQFLDRVAGPDWRSGPWLTEAGILPMVPEASPGCVPVVTQLKLSLGIFASGNDRSREKVIRARFYIDGSLWNPYNRPMELHPGSGSRAPFRVLFWNLPEVRLQNQTMGVSTGWLPLDDAANSLSGSKGLRAWIRTPGLLPAGASLAFSEPDQSSQPQGLARTLHPGFLVGPADRIEMQFRERPGGTYAICLPIRETDPLEAAEAGQGWFRAEAFPVIWPNHVFRRADAAEHPFILENGSLSFRRSNARWECVFTLQTGSIQDGIDPRRHRIHQQDVYPTATGSWISANAFIQAEGNYHESASETLPIEEIESGQSLFSWPAQAPQTLVEAMDLPGWQGGFALGKAGARRLNALFDGPGFETTGARAQTVVNLTQASGPGVSYAPAQSVNCLDAAAWTRLLEKSIITRVSDSENTYIAKYPSVDRGVSQDLVQIHGPAWEEATESIVADLSVAPVASIADWFNAGLVNSHLPEVCEPLLQDLLPVRGWLRESNPLRRYGSAWILHLAVVGRMDQLEVWKSVRVWLLEVPGPEEQNRFEIIRVEPASRKDWGTVNPPA